MGNAAVTTLKGTTLQVTYTSSGADWDVATNVGFESGGIVVSAIKFHPSASADILVINEGSNDGASIVHWKCTAATDDRVAYFQKPKLIHPFIDLTDCTFGTEANVKIIFELA